MTENRRGKQTKTVRTHDMNHPGVTRKRRQASVASGSSSSRVPSMADSDFAYRKLGMLRYMKFNWFANQGLSLADQIRYQKLKKFVELRGPVYPRLVKEFYANMFDIDGVLYYEDRGNTIELHAELFDDVA